MSEDNETVEAPTEVNPTPDSAPAPSTAGLGVQDLLLMLQTIQVVARRGAFRADEMTNVGGLHDRLLTFLEASGAITRSDTPPATDNAPAEEQSADESIGTPASDETTGE